MTAEKLNIQPTERSISRMASRNTMPSASMPRKVVLPSSANRLIGLRKRGRAHADDHHHGDQRGDDADLVRQRERGGGRGVAWRQACRSVMMRGLATTSARRTSRRC